LGRARLVEDRSKLRHANISIIKTYILMSAKRCEDKEYCAEYISCARLLNPGIIIGVFEF